MISVLRDGCSERGTTRVGKRHDPKTVRWYVLAFPAMGVARRDRISPAKSLDTELSRRKRREETLFGYFASSYVEVRKVDGKMVDTKRLLSFNYAFIRPSAEEIFQMKHTLPLYNFLPRVSSGGMTHFSYLSDNGMENLRWVAKSYPNEPPVYVPDSDHLLKDDHAHTTSGYFIGMGAEGAIQPGGGHKDVMVRILDCMWVPLLEVKPGEHELIELSAKGKHAYTHLDNDRLWEGLYDALGRYHIFGSVAEEDTCLARKVLRSYGSLRAEMDVMRRKIYSLLLSAYELLGNEEEFTRLYDMMRGMLPVVKAPQSRVLLSVTLYGCTDSTLYRQMVYGVVDSWRGESLPKKSKSSLIRRLDDCDR